MNYEYHLPVLCLLYASPSLVGNAALEAILSFGRIYHVDGSIDSTGLPNDAQIASQHLLCGCLYAGEDDAQENRRLSRMPH